MNGITLLSTGKALPQKCVTNNDMAAIVETSDEWISSRTGISTRYFCQEQERSWQLAAKAAKEAVEKANISVEEIGLCIVATMSPPFATPSVACLVQRELELPSDTLCFDLNAACTGFVYTLETARALLATNEKPYGLLIGCESLSRIVDFSDRNTCVLFGDGAAAVVVKRSNSQFFAMHGAKGNDKALVCPGYGAEKQYLTMDGKAVFRFAVESIPHCINEILNASGLTLEDIDYIVCHQANRRIIDSVIRQMKAPAEKFYMNLQHYGNTSAASIPLALADMQQQNLLRPGAKLLCVGFGGGFTWGASLVCWKEKE